jgi:hypothetical protein
MQTVTVTFTEKQFDRFQALWNGARESELAMAEMFGHDTPDNIDAFFQLPADALLEDMAEWHAANAVGFSLV